MKGFLNQDLAELAHQLTLSPMRLRIKQLQGVEHLLGMIDAEASYPYELACFHITGYTPKGKDPRPAITGKKLIADLVLLAEHISRKAALPLEALPGTTFTQEDLATKLQVSTKTIRRWRKRGLMGVRAVFDDGVNRQVFLDATIDRFCNQHADLVERGAAFQQLSAEEKTNIIERAAELVTETRGKLHVIARQISEETGRAIETIRYTLRRNDEANPETALFSRGGMPAVGELHRAVWEAHESGRSVDEIATEAGCGKQKVERICREMEIRCLQDAGINFIDSEEFAMEKAEQAILLSERPVPPAKKNGKAPKDSPAYLRSLYGIPLLSAEQERDLFRRYNYIKFKAARLLDSIDPCETTAKQVASLRALLDLAESVKGELIQANLRLVVSIAKRHVHGNSERFFETISDGNISLMRAIENFDYSRGHKFSTYASWAIMKNFARTIPEKHYHYARYVTGQEELLDAAPDSRSAPVIEEQTAGVRNALTTAMAKLTDREREIVTEHFGLFGRSDSLTLEQLGDRFGVTKERIRQIEKRAMLKLREVLSPATLDLLAE